MSARPALLASAGAGCKQAAGAPVAAASDTGGGRRRTVRPYHGRMATIRRTDAAKAALGRQRAELRRGARGRDRIGNDTGAAEARSHEIEKVRTMQQELHAREHDARLEEPISALLVELAADALRLTRTLVLFPFRLVGALRGHRPAEA